jgi:nicotinamide-nucleotide amidase
MKKVVLVAIGDEILSGLRSEGNCSWLAALFHSAGWQVKAIEVVPDDLDVIQETFARWAGKVDHVITSGGLGPTHDDKTRDAVAAFLGCRLKIAEVAYSRIVDRYSDPLKEIVKGSMTRQALIPEKAEPVHNPEGSALGIRFRVSDTSFWIFPGVPSEYKAMAGQEFLSSVIDVNCWRSVWITGWAESLLKDRLGSVFEAPGLHVSVLPSINLVQVVLRGDPDRIHEAEEQIRRDLPEDCLPEGVSTLEEAVLEELQNKKVTIGCAESCTGGMISSSLTDIAGASEFFMGGVVCYSNQSKVDLLGVDFKVIKKYGAVSSQCAEMMAKGAAKVFSSDLALSVTGIAGPGGGTKEKPIGTVWFGLCSGDSVESQYFHFAGTRGHIRARARAKGLELMWRYLKGYKYGH